MQSQRSIQNVYMALSVSTHFSHRVSTIKLVNYRCSCILLFHILTRVTLTEFFNTSTRRWFWTYILECFAFISKIKLMCVKNIIVEPRAQKKKVKRIITDSLPITFTCIFQRNCDTNRTNFINQNFDISRVVTTSLSI